MSLIVAARFPRLDESARAVRRLTRAGVTEDAVHTFYVHTSSVYWAIPMSDSQYVEPEARASEFGAIAGAALLGLILAALCGGIAASFNGPAYLVLLGAGVGGYIGALFGTVWLAGKWRFVEPAPDTDKRPPVHPVSVMLAVQVPAGKEKFVKEALRRSGGEDLERAQGQWVDGTWVDLDPLAPSRPIHG